MTIPATPRRSPTYIGDGVIDTFAFGFKTLDPATLVVTKADPNDGNAVTLVYLSDYTVALNGDQDSSPGGTVTYAGLAEDHRLVITSDIESSQPTAFTNLGAFHAHVLEGALDRLAMLHQQQQEQIDRSAKVPITSNTDPGTYLQDTLDAVTDAAGLAAGAASAAEGFRNEAEGFRDSALLAAANAGDEAALALGYRNSAAGHASNASGSAIAAENARDAAVNAKDDAEDARDAAAQSASDALVSEGNAANSAQAASDDADAAEQARDEVVERYIGSYANDGAANAAHPSRPAGALYWNSASNNLRVWDGSAWLVAATPTSDYLLRDGTLPMTGPLELPAGVYWDPSILFGTNAAIYQQASGSFALRIFDDDVSIKQVNFGAGNKVAIFAPEAISTDYSSNAYGFQSTGGNPTARTNAGIGYNLTDSRVFFNAANGHVFRTSGVERAAIGTSAFTSTVPFRAPLGVAATPSYAFESDTDTGMYRAGADILGFSVGGTAKFSIASSVVSSLVKLQVPAGSEAEPACAFTNDPDTGLYRVSANVLGLSAGGALAFSASSAGCSFSQGGVTTYTVTTTGLLPNPDNTRSLGAISNRWTTVYATSGTINTSDAREKTAVVPMIPAEIAAAKDIAREIGTFQWLESVEKKGDAARKHVGLTVQRAIQIMQSHGLDPFAYAFICYDEWDANEMQDAGDRYSFRVDQLNLFIARGLEARLTALEERL